MCYLVAKPAAASAMGHSSPVRATAHTGSPHQGWNPWRHSPSCSTEGTERFQTPSERFNRQPQQLRHVVASGMRPELAMAALQELYLRRRVSFCDDPSVRASCLCSQARSSAAARHHSAGQSSVAADFL